MIKSRPKYINTERDKMLFLELKRLTYEMIKSLPQSRIHQLKIKLFVYPLIYFGLYLIALYNSNNIGVYFLCFSIMGLMVVVIFCELIHELTHNNIFSKSFHNKIALNLFDLLGANSYIWQKRHLNLHHQYPNVNGWDADIEQKGPISIFPSEENKSITKYQHRYIFLLYPLFMLNWLFIRDFRDFFSKKRIIKKILKIPTIEYFKLFLFKFLYIFTLVIIPFAFAKTHILQALGGLLCLTISGSILAMIVLLTPHINVSNEFPQTNSKGKINTSWFRHQLITTNDIDNSNWFTRNFMGNFNFHVVHHIFPHISSVYTPEVTSLLKSFCKKNNLPYKSYPLSLALKKHYELICKNALSFHEMDL
ncbi:fatty acid desaturase [Mangrovimonas sp. TPBH4]|uniref:fatty acid desaturase family protein n=1 Tax=Mangrovimonas sp. TPBH4 TaxID=1645914 RepID=UPI0006B54D43